MDDLTRYIILVIISFPFGIFGVYLLSMSVKYFRATKSFYNIVLVFINFLLGLVFLLAGASSFLVVIRIYPILEYYKTALFVFSMVLNALIFGLINKYLKLEIDPNKFYQDNKVDLGSDKIFYKFRAIADKKIMLQQMIQSWKTWQPLIFTMIIFAIHLAYVFITKTKIDTVGILVLIFVGGIIQILWLFFNYIVVGEINLIYLIFDKRIEIIEVFTLTDLYNGVAYDMNPKKIIPFQFIDRIELISPKCLRLYLNNKIVQKNISRDKNGEAYERNILWNIKTIHLYGEQKDINKTKEILEKKISK
jgi:hypothetical protein